MTTLNRNELREELKAYREMGYTLQIALTASTEAMQQEYARITELDNAPIQEGNDYADMTPSELAEANVVPTDADSGKHIDEYRASLKPQYLTEEEASTHGNRSRFTIEYCLATDLDQTLPLDEAIAATPDMDTFQSVYTGYSLGQARLAFSKRANKHGLVYLGCTQVEPIEQGEVPSNGYSGYDYCKLEDKELNQFLPDGTLLDNIHSRAFPPEGESYTVQSVASSLNAAGYETTNDKDSVTVFDTEGWITVYPDRLFFNFDGDYDTRIAASLGIDISQKSWLKDDVIELESDEYVGTFRYSVWVFNKAKREYGFEDSFFSLKLAQTFIREELHRTDKIDLRKELYLDGRWQCQKHIEMVST